MLSALYDDDDISRFCRGPYPANGQHSRVGGMGLIATVSPTIEATIIVLIQSALLKITGARILAMRRT